MRLCESSARARHSSCRSPALKFEPASLTVHLPDGPLAAIEAELVRQLTDAGVAVEVVAGGAAAFAGAITTGEAMVFPMVMVGSGFGRSAGIAGAVPGGPDDVFGVDAADRRALVAEIHAAIDPDDRALLVEALDQELARQHLWLPLGNAEVRVGLSEQMNALRILPDGTLDLSGF